MGGDTRRHEAAVMNARFDDARKLAIVLLFFGAEAVFDFVAWLGFLKD
jgi:hypothetical protein